MSARLMTVAALGFVATIVAAVGGWYYGARTPASNSAGTPSAFLPSAMTTPAESPASPGVRTSPGPAASPASAASPRPAASPASPNPNRERKVLYWHDPMLPGTRFDKPGKSPFMDMQLVPVYEDETQGEQGSVKIDPRMLQNLGIRTATVEKFRSETRIEGVGVVAHDENRIVGVTTRTAGYAERLHVRALNDPVKKAQVLIEIFAPDLLAAQEEYVLVRGASFARDRALNDAARQRLLLLGVAEDQIKALERTGKATRRIPIVAPISGMVYEIGIKEGAAVSAGMPLFTLVDLSEVWIIAEIVEQDLARVTLGDAAVVRLPALEGETFKAKVDYIYPELTEKSRTFKVRLSLANSDGRLKPRMLATVSLAGAAEHAGLRVPSEAIIATGQRNVVILAEGEGRFRPVEVELGREAGGKSEVLKGLSEGMKVVASGQFLIDSEANLRSALEQLDDRSGGKK